MFLRCVAVKINAPAARGRAESPVQTTWESNDVCEIYTSNVSFWSRLPQYGNLHYFLFEAGIHHWDTFRYFSGSKYDVFFSNMQKVIEKGRRWKRVLIFHFQAKYVFERRFTAKHLTMFGFFLTYSQSVRAKKKNEKKEEAVNHLYSFLFFSLFPFFLFFRADALRIS